MPRPERYRSTPEGLFNSSILSILPLTWMIGSKIRSLFLHKVCTNLEGVS